MVFFLPPPSKDDKAKVESGRDLPEGTLNEKPVKYYEVLCPKCKARPGYPCTYGYVGGRSVIDLWSIHIARVMLYEAYALNQVNELGIDSHGQIRREMGE